MPIANVRGVDINYDIYGQQGPWVAIAPGGRRGIEGVQALGHRLADAGYRVLVHDRRNCGASSVSATGPESEYEIWADDLHALLQHLGGLPAYVGGCSSGCRLAVLFALRHPAGVHGLLLWRVTGGLVAARRLADKYYGEYIRAAQAGGMAAVCATEHFSERIKERPQNRDDLMRMDPKAFIAAMQHWSDYFLQGAELPIIGATEEQIRSISAPACVIPGNDNSHPRAVGEKLASLLPRAELHHLIEREYDMDLSPRAEWDAADDRMAAIFTAFMKKNA